ncbi:MAG: hypothetical protein QW200_07940 [Ignisphaera sp.]
MDLYKAGIILIIAGFILLFIAALLPLTIYLLSPATGMGSVEIGGGGCILLFFIPICFGVGSQAVLLIIVALILALIAMIFGYIIYRSIRNDLQRSFEKHGVV